MKGSVWISAFLTILAFLALMWLALAEGAVILPDSGVHNQLCSGNVEVFAGAAPTSTNAGVVDGTTAKLRILDIGKYFK